MRVAYPEMLGVEISVLAGLHNVLARERASAKNVYLNPLKQLTSPTLKERTSREKVDTSAWV